MKLKKLTAVYVDEPNNAEGILSAFTADEINHLKSVEVKSGVYLLVDSMTLTPGLLHSIQEQDHCSAAANQALWKLEELMREEKIDLLLT